MTSIAPMRQRFLPFFLLLAGFLSLAASECWAMETSSDPHAPLQVKMVEIKGAKVRLPIPDGYEEMRREDSPRIYDWMVDTAAFDGRIPLAYFINSMDKKKLKKDDERIRYSIVFADHAYYNIKSREYALEGELRSFLFSYIKDMIDIINSVEKEFNNHEFENKSVDVHSRSFSFVFKRKMQKDGIQGLEAMAWSFILLDRKIVEVHFYQFDHEGSEVRGNRVYNYLKKIDRGLF